MKPKKSNGKIIKDEGKNMIEAFASLKVFKALDTLPHTLSYQEQNKVQEQQQ